MLVLFSVYNAMFRMLVLSWKVSYCILIAVIVQSVVGQRIPPSACPNVFHYEPLTQPNDMRLKGVITVPPFIPLVLKVMIEVPVFLKSKFGRLELEGSGDDFVRKINTGTLQEVKFNLFFPNNVPVPDITLIEVNHQVLCSITPIRKPMSTKATLEYTIRPKTSNQPFNNNNGYVWNFPNDYNPSKPVQSSRPLPNNMGKYISNPFLNPPPEENAAPEYGPPKNGKDLKFLFWDFSTNSHDEDPLFQELVNVLKSDSHTPFPPGPKFIDRPNEPSTPPPPRPLPPPQNPPLPQSVAYPSHRGRVSNTCGQAFSLNPLVVDGKRARRGEWPWLVALFKRVDLGVLFVCGSTLISDQYVVTAAHCVYKFTDSVSEGALIAYVGRFNLRDWAEPGAEPREISRVYIHPEYRNESLYSDIAVLKLQRLVKLSPFVNPACLWSEGEDTNRIVGSNGVVVGWGKDGNNRTITEIPKMLKIPIVSKEECLDSKLEFKFFASNKTFCAGNRDGRGPCNGDSGSGFLIPRTDANGNTRWFLRGIVSLSLHKFGDNAYECDLSQYIVFTDIAKFRNWLSEFISIGF